MMLKYAMNRVRVLPPMVLAVVIMVIPCAAIA
jgi:hypothetical protein